MGLAHMKESPMVFTSQAGQLDHGAVQFAGVGNGATSNRSPKRRECYQIQRQERFTKSSVVILLCGQKSGFVAKNSQKGNGKRAKNHPKSPKKVTDSAPPKNRLK